MSMSITRSLSKRNEGKYIRNRVFGAREPRHDSPFNQIRNPLFYNRICFAVHEYYLDDCIIIVKIERDSGKSVLVFDLYHALCVSMWTRDDEKQDHFNCYHCCLPDHCILCGRWRSVMADCRLSHPASCVYLVRQGYGRVYRPEFLYATSHNSDNTWLFRRFRRMAFAAPARNYNRDRLADLKQMSDPRSIA